MRTLSAEEFKKQYGTEAYTQLGGSKPQGSGYFQRVMDTVKKTASGLKSSLGKQADTIAQQELNPNKQQRTPNIIKAVARGGLRTAGAAAQTALAPVMEAPGIKQATDYVGKQIAKTTPAQKFAEWSQKHPEAAKDIENVLDVAGLFGGRAVGEPAVKGVGRIATDVADRSVTATRKAVAGAADRVPGIVQEGKRILEPPPPTPLKAVGQVLQGETRDLKSGIRALKAVDTTGVKSYEELLTKVDDSIGNLSKEVDATLDAKTPVGLKELQVKGKTAGGQTVKVDYVVRGLENLEEMYTAVGDDLAAKNIQETIKKAKTVGLTRQEVNNVARKYGSEFGEKAFSKKGDALTSVNAQRFENTRKGLKDVARQGITGEKAKALDESISSLYRVRDLVKKNVEAVNKLNQKIQERGLLEKLGYYVGKTADVLSGGSLRGVFGGLLPRGVGYKVMNALDMEQALKRNLEVIQKALKAKDPELMRLLKKAEEKNLLNKTDAVK